MSKQIIVVKLGTSVLTNGTDHLDNEQMRRIVNQCVALKQQGHQVVVVSSGAMAAGREQLNNPTISNTMANKQMLAAVGQSSLIQRWEALFSEHQLNIGQLLLTRADLKDRERFLNARDAINALLEHNIVPIVNENDAVATAEIKVGDNDNLSALVGILCNADKLLLLTDQRGLFTADPRSNPEAELIREVTTIDETLRKIAGGSGTNLGTGGMATKLQAADIARRSGIEVIIAAGSQNNVILDSVLHHSQGTRFLPLEDALENRKRWILSGPNSVGSLFLDQGAANAILNRGSSLLAKGLIKIQGQFERGEVVQLFDHNERLIAKGITSYSHQDLSKIIGAHSRSIESILGHDYGATVIHRDVLVVLDDA